MFDSITGFALPLADTLGEVGVLAVAASVVRNPVRQAVLTILVEQERTTRRYLAEALPGRMDEGPATVPDALELVLHHNHLPRLDEELYIEYDPRSGDVVLWQDARAVARQLSEDR